ncbi:MAG: glutamine synthetase [Elusimicrobia bacterium]|nr:glutamine synthetase [Elusimicrobiota bacterium]
MTPEQILQLVQERDIRFIRLWFVDILGQLKAFAITSRELEGALKDGMGFDGSSIEGFARIYESDLVAKPIPETFQVLPWRPKEAGVARMFCDILTPEGKPFPGDPRYILKQLLAQAAKMGFTYYTGPELEYFYFKSPQVLEGLDEGGYFDSVLSDESHDLRRQTILYLEQMGIPVEYSHHEVAASQHEIDLRYADALIMADRVITHKVVVKQVAHAAGVYASFMPKPIAGINGSGMHVHQSLFKEGQNAFFSAKDPCYLSDLARHFIAGILKHAREICLVTNQWVNSYKRLVPGYEAPVYICWGRRNRSALVRIPEYKPGRSAATRIEVRFPDPACNPYLAFAVLLAAGLAGVRGKYPLPDPVEADVYEMSELERHAKLVETLPGSLIEALEVAEGSSIVREVLGEPLFTKLLLNKRIEWDAYRTHVSDYELKRYLPIL